MSCHSYAHAHAHAHAHAQVITAWGAYISVHLIMLLAIYLLAPSDFVQMCATPQTSPSHTLAIARTLTLVLALTPILALALTLALTLPLGSPEPYPCAGSPIPSPGQVS